MNKLCLGVGILLPCLLISTIGVPDPKYKKVNPRQRSVSHLDEKIWLNKYQDTLNYYMNNIKNNTLNYKINNIAPKSKRKDLEYRSKKLDELNNQCLSYIYYLDQELTEVKRIRSYNKCK